MVTMSTEFRIPELGENVGAGDVVRNLVKPGDTRAKHQPVLELETDKATIEVPSDVAGVVKELKVKTGDKVKVGQVVLTLDESAPAASASAAGAATADKSAAAPATPATGTADRSAKASGHETGAPSKSAGAKPADPAAAKHEDLAGAEPAPAEDADIVPSKVVDI